MTDKNEPMIGCALGCWLVALLVGLLTAALLMVLGDWMVIQALFAGVLLAGVSGALISWILCKPLPGPGEVRLSAAAPTPERPASTPAPAVKPVEAGPAPAAVMSSVPAGPAVRPTVALSGQAELSQRKGTWKYEAQPAPASGRKAAKPPAASSAPKAAAKPERKAVAADGMPELLSAPRDGGADDLKLIGGVGPKLEQTLNELGVWHFEQVARWRKKEVAWVDERLRFKGRIERDDWIGQAKILAKGGDTEFSRKKRKG